MDSLEFETSYAGTFNAAITQAVSTGSTIRMNKPWADFLALTVAKAALVPQYETLGDIYHIFAYESSYVYECYVVTGTADGTAFEGTYKAIWNASLGGGYSGIVYPGAGIVVSTGSGWGSSTSFPAEAIQPLVTEATGSATYVIALSVSGQGTLIMISTAGATGDVRITVDGGTPEVFAIGSNGILFLCGDLSTSSSPVLLLGAFKTSLLVEHKKVAGTLTTKIRYSKV